MNYTEKQIQILEIAEKLFADKGFAGTSVRDIAKEAEVNIAMISYYFGSKEKLMEAIFAFHRETAKLQLESIIQNEKLSPIQKVEHLIDHYIDKYFSKICFHRIVMREQLNSKGEAIRSMMKNLKKQNIELIQVLIAEGQKKGVFKKNIDVPLIMCIMLGTTNQLMTSQDFYREIHQLDAMSDEQFQNHLRKKLSTILKNLFKAILTNEPKNS